MGLPGLVLVGRPRLGPDLPAGGHEGWFHFLNIFGVFGTHFCVPGSPHGSRGSRWVLRSRITSPGDPQSSFGTIGTSLICLTFVIGASSISVVHVSYPGAPRGSRGDTSEQQLETFEPSETCTVCVWQPLGPACKYCGTGASSSDGIQERDGTAISFLSGALGDYADMSSVNGIHANQVAISSCGGNLENNNLETTDRMFRDLRRSYLVTVGVSNDCLFCLIFNCHSLIPFRNVNFLESHFFDMKIVTNSPWDANPSAVMDSSQRYVPKRATCSCCHADSFGYCFTHCRSEFDCVVLLSLSSSRSLVCGSSVALLLLQRGRLNFRPVWWGFSGVRVGGGLLCCTPAACLLCCTSAACLLCSPACLLRADCLLLSRCLSLSVRHSLLLCCALLFCFALRVLSLACLPLSLGLSVSLPVLLSVSLPVRLSVSLSVRVPVSLAVSPFRFRLLSCNLPSPVFPVLSLGPPFLCFSLVWLKKQRLKPHTREGGTASHPCTVTVYT